jgi:hypothetical protein
MWTKDCSEVCVNEWKLGRALEIVAEVQGFVSQREIEPESSCSRLLETLKIKPWKFPGLLDIEYSFGASWKVEG